MPESYLAWMPQYTQTTDKFIKTVDHFLNNNGNILIYLAQKYVKQNNVEMYIT